VDTVELRSAGQLGAAVPTWVSCERAAHEIPILGIVSTFFLQFSCLPLFMLVESKHKAAFAKFRRMPPFVDFEGGE
jgi:hypothetical protein